MRKEIQIPDIYFKESIFQGAILSEDNKLKIFIVTVDLKKVVIEFSNLLQMKFSHGTNVNGIFEKIGISMYVQNALEVIFDNAPILHSFKHYQVEGLDDNPIIELVADSIKVFVRK